MRTFKSIQDGDITLEDLEKEQKELKRDSGRIKQGDPRNKSEEQKKIIDNVKNLYKAREEVAKMFNDYAKNMSKHINKLKQGTGLKILLLKKCFKNCKQLLQK